MDEYFCKNKNTKDGLSCWCKSCEKRNKESRKQEIADYNKEYRLNNKERIQITGKIWFIKNKETRKTNKKQYDARYRELNKSRIKLAKKKWSKKNLLAIKEGRKPKKETRIGRSTSDKSRAACREYKKNNKAKMSCLQMKRHATKLKATPKWLTKADFAKIELFYVECAKISKETGIKHHVDHIVPLQGSDVSGLHVPWNLQILTAKENIRKGNKNLSKK